MARHRGSRCRPPLGRRLRARVGRERGPSPARAARLRLRFTRGGVRRMRVLVVSGIWPPDVGGPATHAPEVAEFLGGHGHAVEVVTTAGAEPQSVGYPIRYTPRGPAARPRRGRPAG